MHYDLPERRAVADYLVVGAVGQPALAVVVVVVGQPFLVGTSSTLKLLASRPSSASILPIFLRRSME